MTASTLSLAANCSQPPVNGGLYSIISFGNGAALDIAGRSTAAGAKLLGWDYSNSRHQQFYLEDLGTGYWTIRAAHSGQPLDVLNFSTAEGGAIIQWPATGAANQQWLLKKSTTGAYNIVSRLSGKSLSASANARGASIVQKADRALGSQRWYFNPVGAACGSSTQVNGFAAQPGNDGLASTTGGGAATAVTVTSCAELISALAAPTPAVVQIADKTTLDCHTAPRPQVACPIKCAAPQDNPNKVFYRVPVGSQSCSSLGSTSDALVARSRNETLIRVKSDKTLLGLGAASGISGAVLDLSNSRNVIIRNLTLEEVNPELVEAGDGVTLNNSSHVWLDHLRFKRISDGHVDISASRNVTLSWNQFDGYNTAVCGNQHHYTSLVQDSQVSLHHNLWQRVSGRNPKMTGPATRAHLYNNHWQDVSYFAVSADAGAQGKLEANFFENSAKPHWNQGNGYLEANVSSNRYTGISETDAYKDTGSKALTDTPLYLYHADPVDKVPELLRNGSGPR
ncbi:MAG: RICIN domain-containing protein [Pseudomonas sp.]|uniref:RICIN domain-containing protein n=1 Tax=Pseudomonas sp. TaxID=306 RepID=UPI003399C54A